jgi:hypothetical protein
MAAALRRTPPAERPPIFGDGHAAQRIAEVVVAYLQSTSHPEVETAPLTGARMEVAA